jgi:hypothetical protein
MGSALRSVLLVHIQQVIKLVLAVEMDTIGMGEAALNYVQLAKYSILQTTNVCVLWGRTGREVHV